MSIPDISDSSPGYFALPLQESSSWGGKVVTKVHEVTSYVISSISSVAQSILSSCIYVGTLGHYALDDLKDYFSKENTSLEDNNDTPAVSSKEDDIEETDVSELASALRKAQLKRHESKMSIDSATFRRFHSPHDSQYLSLYPSLGDTVKLSTHQKTPEERLAEMEKSVINKGK